jgi:hypothetical protein
MYEAFPIELSELSELVREFDKAAERCDIETSHEAWDKLQTLALLLEEFDYNQVVAAHRALASTPSAPPR